nr:PREDICTED: 10 kDa heat shock protein, mitochondrial [Paralichthys olivaceus]
MLVPGRPLPEFSRLPLEGTKSQAEKRPPRPLRMRVLESSSSRVGREPAQCDHPRSSRNPAAAPRRLSAREHVQRNMAFRKFLPLFDRVLVERLTAETVTKGGIMLPEKAQGKVLQATVMAVGPGSVNQKGDIQAVSVKVGEKVLLPEYGGTKIVLEDKDYFLFRDADILGKYTE